MSTADARPLRGRPTDAAHAGEYALTWSDFDSIRDTLFSHAGIVLDETKAPLVYSRLAKRLRTLGMESFRQYCALLVSGTGGDERQRMMAALTTNVTKFFREPHHFEYLRSAVLPDLLERAARGDSVRIWSAGCSMGQEPYSIAFTVLSMMPSAPAHDIRILATDIDPNVIAIARNAEYADDVVADISPEMRRRFLRRKAEGDWVVADAPRELIRFNELNLMGAWPMRRPFDILFCRNVVIYFNAETQARLWGRYADALVPGGTLFIGHSERVSGPALSTFETVGLTAYRKARA